MTIVDTSDKARVRLAAAKVALELAETVNPALPAAQTAYLKSIAMSQLALIEMMSSSQI